MRPHAKNEKRRRPGNRKPRPQPTSGLTAAALTLPDDELRRLVLDIILRDDIKTFIRRMLPLLDSLRAGRLDKLTRLARRNTDPSFAALLSSLSVAAADGRILAAYHTAFLATAYAYQQSLDHVRELMSYLDGIKQCR